MFGPNSLLCPEARQDSTNNPDGRERLLAVSELEVSLWGLTAPPAGLVVARMRG